MMKIPTSLRDTYDSQRETYEILKQLVDEVICNDKDPAGITRAA